MGSWVGATRRSGGSPSAYMSSFQFEYTCTTDTPPINTLWQQTKAAFATNSHETSLKAGGKQLSIFPCPSVSWGIDEWGLNRTQPARKTRTNEQLVARESRAGYAAAQCARPDEAGGVHTFAQQTALTRHRERVCVGWASWLLASCVQRTRRPAGGVHI